MAWEQRGAGFYFYRSVRRGSRVVKVYGGAGVIGQLAEQAAEADRFEREEQREQERAEIAALLDACGPEAPLADFAAEMDSFVAEALRAAGFHRHHRGEWRRRRA